MSFRIGFTVDVAAVVTDFRAAAELEARVNDALNALANVMATVSGSHSVGGSGPAWELVNQTPRH